MSIGKKLVGGYAIVLTLLAAVTLAGVYSLDQIEASYGRFVDVNERLVHLASRLRITVNSQVANYRGALVYPDARERFLADLQADYRNFEQVVGEMRQFKLAGEEAALLNEIAALQGKYEQAQLRILGAVDGGQRDQALAQAEEAARPLALALTERADRFSELQLAQVTAGRDQLAARIALYGGLMWGVALLGFVAALGLGVYLSRAITRQLKEGVTQLAASSSEILATTTQVASGAAQTATAVSETTATVEEVKQTAQVASQKARSVSDTAQKAAQVSQAGRRAVDDAIQGMQRIREQMESIAGSIVRLSEQSQAIGEIIASVNDLAEQSNLLAVNAAIEASRAGEQGKGFSVVAQEIKSLAQQSKQSTSQVRTLLSEIQKATSAAVLATEQGSKAVEAGVRQSTDAGESIRQLADSIAEAAQAATQIAASSQQQMVGMDQVALAMENIKQASAQNVAGTKQAETAAQDLHQLGLRLSALIGGKAA